MATLFVFAFHVTPMFEFEYSVRKANAPYMTEFSGLKLDVLPCVYEPHDDSFLLAEAALKHARGRVLDLGCGTGIVGGLAAGRNKAVTEVVFADVNPEALKLAEKNVRQNSLKKLHSFVRTDLFSSLTGQKFDTICFNPPYLPTGKAEKVEGLENAAFDGGPNGRRVLDRFLAGFEAHLAKCGQLLLLNSSVSAKDGESGNKITKKKLEKAGFAVETIGKKRFFFEELVVFKASRKFI